MPRDHSPSSLPGLDSRNFKTVTGLRKLVEVKKGAVVRSRDVARFSPVRCLMTLALIDGAAMRGDRPDPRPRSLFGLQMMQGTPVLALLGLGIGWIGFNLFVTSLVIHREKGLRRTVLVIGIWVLPYLGAVLAWIGVAPAGVPPSSRPDDSNVPWQ